MKKIFLSLASFILVVGAEADYHCKSTDEQYNLLAIGNESFSFDSNPAAVVLKNLANGDVQSFHGGIQTEFTRVEVFDIFDVLGPNGEKLNFSIHENPIKKFHAVSPTSNEVDKKTISNPECTRVSCDFPSLPIKPVNPKVVSTYSAKIEIAGKNHDFQCVFQNF